MTYSRIDAEEQVEHLVSLNNTEAPVTVDVPTYSRGMRFEPAYGDVEAVTSVDDGRVSYTVPPLSSVVLVANAPTAESRRAPKVSLVGRPRQSEVDAGRVAVQAAVSGTGFNEVTFLARTPGAKGAAGRWASIGTDDSAPYRVFHDVADLPVGTRVQYRAVVLDNAGHTRASDIRTGTVEPPRLAIGTSGEDGEVSSIDPVVVTATPDPEDADQVVTFQRRVGSGAWSEIGTDSSSPVYTVRDDVSDLPLGSTVTYRAVLREGSVRVTSPMVSVTTAAPRPARDQVTVAGNLQSEMGCPGDWDPACHDSDLAFDSTDGLWHGTFTLPAGDYEWKVAVDGSWDENYGAGGAAGGGNLALSVPAGGGTYVFTWDQVSKVPSVAPKA